MTGTIDPTIINLTVFVLAVFVGYHVIWNVTPGAAHAAHVGDQRDLLGHHRRRDPGGRRRRRSTSARARAPWRSALAAVNVFGGFLVTQRMLRDVQEKRTQAEEGEA